MRWNRTEASWNMQRHIFTAIKSRNTIIPGTSEPHVIQNLNTTAGQLHTLNSKTSLTYFTLKDMHTNYKEQSPSWEANSHSASQEVPRLLWNPKVHYRVHKSLPLVPVFTQIKPIHTFPQYEGVSKSYRTSRLERELQMVQLSAIRCTVLLFCQSV